MKCKTNGFQADRKNGSITDLTVNETLLPCGGGRFDKLISELYPYAKDGMLNLMSNGGWRVLRTIGCNAGCSALMHAVHKFSEQHYDIEKLIKMKETCLNFCKGEMDHRNHVPGKR